MGRRAQMGRGRCMFVEIGMKLLRGRRGIGCMILRICEGVVAGLMGGECRDLFGSVVGVLVLLQRTCGLAVREVLE